MEIKNTLLGSVYAFREVASSKKISFVVSPKFTGYVHIAEFDPANTHKPPREHYTEFFPNRDHDNIYLCTLYVLSIFHIILQSIVSFATLAAFLATDISILLYTK